MRVAGIDGYRDGWIAVVADAGHFRSSNVNWDVSLETLLEQVGASIAVVDMPIGLSSGPHARPVEASVRKLLGRKSSSVFNSPCRQVLDCTNYEDAAEMNREVLGKGLSKQTWAIVPKIREADGVAQRVGQDKVKEGHPEVSFSQLNDGSPILASKRSAKGTLARAGILAKLGFDLSQLAEQLPDNHTAATDDLLDAAILTWTATRVSQGNHMIFPEAPITDDRGLEMSILA